MSDEHDRDELYSLDDWQQFDRDEVERRERAFDAIDEDWDDWTKPSTDWREP